jgi:hypothetical protein
MDPARGADSSTARCASLAEARRCAGPDSPALRDDDGFVDTGDLLSGARGRYSVGRRGDHQCQAGSIPGVEAVISRRPDAMSLVPRRNPSPARSGRRTVLRAPAEPADAAGLPPPSKPARSYGPAVTALEHVPAAIRIVPALDVGASGKLARQHA